MIRKRSPGQEFDELGGLRISRRGGAAGCATSAFAGYAVAVLPARILFASLAIAGCAGDDQTDDAAGDTTSGTTSGSSSSGMTTASDESTRGDTTGATSSTGADETTTEGSSTGPAETTTGTDTGSTDTGAQVDGSRVFVTSTKYDGNLGGLLGADDRCQTQADAAALGGTWLAWLGDGREGPAMRFVQSEDEYRLVTGEVIAEDFADLIDGTIAVPINIDETGTPLPDDDDMIVWTAVFHTGGEPTPVNCEGWTVADESIVPTGLASATDSGWTVSAPFACSEMHRLYCFEQ